MKSVSSGLRTSSATPAHTAGSNSHFKQLFALVSLIPNLVKALPINNDNIVSIAKKEVPLTSTEYYIYMFTSIFLVLLGGIFAGLTLGLMGQDEVYLKVMCDSGTPDEQRCARRVLKLLGKGKHWLLVTLLLGNVITNETLPVILDRFLGGGFVAVFSSTVSIVIFGEIIPQSVCVRYGLQLGAWFAPYVQVLMYIMYPVAYPTAKLLDRILGEDHGTLYKKSGLKALVTLHQTMGVERLNDDEVTIITAVLDLKAKSVSEVMTPVNKVFTLSSDTILDEKTIEQIFNAGFSRIPIYLPGEPTNYVGMLLVRILISYDPEDALPISSFPLATLPETSLETSCLSILNYFQEGKSHMVIVSETPGREYGAKGVLTLEDVIEELIGEEIIDESDVYVDVNKNIKRTIPGPLTKRNVTAYLHSVYTAHSKQQPSLSKKNSLLSTIDNQAPLFIKRDSLTDLHNISSTTANGFKPSNLASSPLQTKNTNITIKKQPNLSTVASPLLNPSDQPKSDKTPLVPPVIRTTLSRDYGSSSTEAETVSHTVHQTEAEAFIHGILVNAERKKDSVSPTARGGVADSGSAIPLPHPDRFLDISLNNSAQSSRSGLIESVINVKGVNKTVIEESHSEFGSGSGSGSGIGSGNDSN